MVTNIYTHRRQIFRFEHKAFYFDIHDNGSKVIIKEMNRLHSYSIQIDFGGVKWLIEGLKSVAYNFNEIFKPKKYQASYALFVMERDANKNGSFIRLVELRKGTSMNTVIFPAGIKGNGWRGIADSLQRILGCPSSGEKKVNHKEVVRNYQQVSSGRRVVSRLSYAEIVKNCELNKEDLTRGKQAADTMNVRGVIEWKRVVVCIRELLWDSWRGIQNSLNKFYKTNFQLKPFLTDKAMFLCKSEEEAEMYGNKGLVFLSGPFAIKLQRWEEESIYQNRKIACTGGWINIQGLPVAWWNEKVFRKIGERCRGLIEIDKRTRDFQNLLEAKIKVKGNHNGFIQALLQVQMDSCSNPFILSLSSTSKLDLRQRSPKEYLMSMKQYKGNYQNLEDILIISDTKQGYFDNEMEEGLRSELEKGEGSRSTINERGLHETRKDQIIVKKVSFADQIQKSAEAEVPEDSDYGISSFGDVASSEGTIIEETQEGVRKEEAGPSHRNSSLETDEEEEWVMKGPRKFVKGPVEGLGWNRLKKSKLTRFKWSPKPIQTYKRRKKECCAMLKASDGEDSDKEDMIEDKWAETLLENNKQIDNNYLEEDIEFMSDGDNMEMTDDEARQAYEATSESNDEYVSNSEES
ncbi:hypothetical protein LguiA_012532 [Lonicera macranthoides]